MTTPDSLDRKLDQANPYRAAAPSSADSAMRFLNAHVQPRRRRILTGISLGVVLGVVGVSAATAAISKYAQPDWASTFTVPAVMPDGQRCEIEFSLMPAAGHVSDDPTLARSTAEVQRASQAVQSVDFTTAETLQRIETSLWYRDQMEVSASTAEERKAADSAQRAVEAEQVAHGQTPDPFPNIYDPFRDVMYAYGYGAMNVAEAEFARVGIDPELVSFTDNSYLTLRCGDYETGVSR